MSNIFAKIILFTHLEPVATFLFLPNLHLAIIGLVASLGSPGPALLIARTLNSYVPPSLSPSWVAERASPGTSTPFTQSLPNFSCKDLLVIMVATFHGSLLIIVTL